MLLICWRPLPHSSSKPRQNCVMRYFGVYLSICLAMLGHSVPSISCRSISIACSRLSCSAKDLTMGPTTYGFGLQARSSRHKAPHTRTEVRILLNVYRQHQLHSRCIGRRLRDDDSGNTIDGFRRGAEHLRKTKLAAWVKDTTSTRGMDIQSKLQAGNELPTDAQTLDLIASEEIDSADDVDDQAAIPTLGYIWRKMVLTLAKMNLASTQWSRLGNASYCSFFCHVPHP
ncbi:hypothetical protein SCLCIDRAFT_628974 [Scleroderma citrinum Foug A]|uniref:Uncharacterized protein n=1 Tax=Scleroderma citrinum Foug A TaxID=1036808 RepID=A0A0C3D631_9AGAM|nr:hypothetical protein SCLCIDRAFT_628974 [Scleroderma citrinum Foug A]